MPILHLDLKPIQGEAVALRSFWDNPNHYDERVLSLKDIGDRVEQAEAGYYVSPKNQVDLTVLGRELFRWLDGADRWLVSKLNQHPGQGVVLAIATVGRLAALPWEVLHDGAQFLVQRQPAIVPVRWLASDSVTRLQEVSTPRNGALNVLFMASSPRDVAPVLDYEEEETQILRATARPTIGLTVEESGCLEELGYLVDSYGRGAFDVVHLTGHAEIQDSQPRFITETLTGKAHYASARDIARTLKTPMPPLVFLSGCRTGQSAEAGAVPSMAEQLLADGATAVLGWGQKVLDTDATAAAAALYEALSRSQSVAEAIASTYQVLIQQEARDWHLLRLYAAHTLPGSLIKPRRTPGWKPAPKPSIASAFLDPLTKQIRVATREEFVGRRRQLQNCLRELTTNPETIAVLIHGMGGLGKSSVAARLCDRLPLFRRLVWQGRIDPQSLVHELAKEIDDRELRQRLLDPEEELRYRLRSVFAAPAEQGKPSFLLVLDDFEDNLEAQGAAYVMKPPAADVMNSLIGAIQQTDTGHRLILTSRYDFELTESQVMYRQPLDAMQGADLQKKCDRLPQLKPPENQSAENQSAEAATTRTLQAQVKRLADGNPRLLELLHDRVLKPQQIDRAAQLEQLSADPTELQQAVLERRVLAQMQDGFTEMLSRGLVFELPVPRSAFAEVTAEDDLIDRAIGLGLLEVSPDETLRVPRILPLSLPEDDQPLYTAAAQTLYRDWWQSRQVRTESQCLEIHRLALVAGAAEISAELGALLGHRWCNQSRFQEAVALGEKTIALAPDYRVYHSLARSQEVLGKVQAALNNYQQARNTCPETDQQEKSAILHNLAIIYAQQGQVQQAIDLYQQSLDAEESIGDVQGKAATLHQLAGIYFQQGQVQQAIDFYQQSLDIYESIGDVQGKAATLHCMAIIYAQQGQVQQAIDLYQQSLDATELIGNVQGKAATLSQLSAIEFERGETVKALELLQRSAQALVQAQAFADLFTVLSSLGGVDEARSQIYLAQALWLGLRTQPAFPTLINLLRFFYNRVPQGDPLEAMLATTALFFCQTRGENHPQLEELQNLSVNMLAGAAAAQGVEVSSMDDLSRWMAEQQLNDPQVFFPQLMQQLESIVGDEWLFDRSKVG